MRAVALVIAFAAAATLAGCSEPVVRPPNTAVLNTTQQHDSTEPTPTSGTLRQCPPSAINC
jgi:ABC-type uncharacterized transport system auxiliary subunit